MEFLPLSFLAGILTVLAPCVLPILPVIIGGTLAKEDKKRPLIITLSLSLSIVIFTLLLKATTAFINIPQSFWTWFSSGIIFIFAVSLLFPSLWPRISLWLKNILGNDQQENKSQKILFKFYNKKGFWPAVILGGALGPVFASCSPTYFLILGTVLPASFLVGLINLIVYSLGLGLVMFAIAYAGQRFSKTLNIAADPKGWFKKGLGVLFLAVALLVATGYDKKLSTTLLDNGFFDVTKVEQSILDKRDAKENTRGSFEEEGILNIKVPAPDLKGLTDWINSSPYTSLDELKGKVVLIDFWTYSCINCIRTLPYLQSWHERYADDGLVILGIHAPEFAFERKPENVAKAALDYGLTYSIALDNDFATWKNYNNRYWPAKYLIDKEGNIRYYHFGEGEYDSTEQAITMLLGTEMQSSDIVPAQELIKDVQTSETYLGTQRRANYAADISADDLKLNQWSLVGDWQSTDESVVANTLPASISMKFHASEANLVIDGDATAIIFIDGEFYKTITIDGAKLYTIFDSEEYREHAVSIEFSGEHVEVFAWTFG